MRKSFVVFASLALCAAFFSGCRGPSARVDNRVPGVRVIAKRTRMNGDLAEVQAEIRNTRRSRVPIEYRFRWTDGEGFAVDDVRTQWTPLSMRAGETKALKGVAPSPEAKDAEIIIRPPDPHRP